MQLTEGVVWLMDASCPSPLPRSLQQPLVVLFLALSVYLLVVPSIALKKRSYANILPVEWRRPSVCLCALLRSLLGCAVAIPQKQICIVLHLLDCIALVPLVICLLEVCVVMAGSSST